MTQLNPMEEEMQKKKEYNKPKRKNFPRTFILDSPTYERLREEAYKTHMSLSSLIRHILQKYFKMK